MFPHTSENDYTNRTSKNNLRSIGRKVITNLIIEGPQISLPFIDFYKKKLFKEARTYTDDEAPTRKGPRRTIGSLPKLKVVVYIFCKQVNCSR